MTIKRFDVLSVAKIAAVVYAGLGLIGGLFFACFALLGFGFAAAAQEGGPHLPQIFSLMFGVGAIVAFPVMYAVIGFVMGAFTTWLFNVAAGITGGVRIQVEP